MRIFDGSGQIQGLLRHVQSLIQRPAAGEIEPSREVRPPQPTGSATSNQGDGGGGAPANDEQGADPAERAARAANAGEVHPRGTFLDITV